MFSRKKILTVLFDLPIPRTVSEDMLEISLEEFRRRRQSNIFHAALLEDGDEALDEYSLLLDFLMQTRLDLKKSHGEIEKLWTLCIEEFKKFSGDVSDFNSVYIFPLVSISGEAEIKRTFLQTQLSALGAVAITKLLENDLQGGDISHRVQQITDWFSYDKLYLDFFGIGSLVGDISYLITFLNRNIQEFEVLKALSPLLFLKLVSLIRTKYNSVDLDYASKFYNQVLALSLQAIMVARNAGLFDGYDDLLRNYYGLRFHDRVWLNWLFYATTGFGEKPWRLVWVLLFFNVAFAMLFSVSGLSFHGICAASTWWSKFSDFVYFNNTTMLTVGYGDIYPVDSVAKLLVALLQLGGFAISSAAIALFLRRILRF